MKFYIKTLGCKVNWLDSARVTSALQSAGHLLVDSENEADHVFINTCTVTAEADRKSRQIAQSSLNRDKHVSVMGCSPRVNQAIWDKKSDKSTVFTNENQLFRYFDINVDELPYPLSTGRTRYPIAIQRGCDNHCSFCITKVARGGHINIPSATIIDQIKYAQDQGIKEIVLTGINLAAWGCDDTNQPEQSKFDQLIEQILNETSISRIRLSSLGPEYINDRFFDLFSDERLCDYLHLSVQSGSNTVLKRMQRNHGTDEIINIGEKARKVRPDTGIACDMIIGFPGESDDEFKQTQAFINTVQFSKMHVFPFSMREGTEAAKYKGQLDGHLKKERASLIRERAAQLRKLFLQSQIGKQHAVLTEGNHTGLTGNYIRVEIPNSAEGEIKTVTLSEDVILQ